MNINNAHIVVAHYNEPLDWLLNYHPNNITIYSKGTDVNSKYSSTIIKTDNIGREAHTYLKYIIDNYDALPDFIFFTQGSPFDHIKSPINCYVHPTEIAVGNWIIDETRTYYLHNMHIYFWSNSQLEQNPLTFDKWFMKYIEPLVNPSMSPMAISYGATFTIHREQILSRSKEFYQTLIEQLTTNNTETAHFLERAWYYIFNLHKIIAI
jgi:hypothetical protein